MIFPNHKNFGDCHMEAAIAAFQKPNTAPEITDFIELTWRTHVQYIEVLTREQREKVSQDLFLFCEKLSINTNDDNVYTLILACGIIFRSYLLDLSQLFPLFDKLFVATREVDMIAIAKLMIYISAQTDEINPIFAKRYIKKSLTMINSKKQTDIKFGLIILQEYITKLASLIILHFPNISLSLWTTVQNQNDQIRRLGISVFSIYIQELAKVSGFTRKITFQKVYRQSLDLLMTNQYRNQHTAILIIAALISFQSNIFEDEALTIYKNLSQFLTSSHHPLRISAISTLIQISKINQELFKETVFTAIFQSLMTMIVDRNTIVLTIDTITTMVDQIPAYIYVKIPSIIIMIDQIPNDSRLQAMTRILNLFLKIIDLDPKLLDSNDDIIWRIVESNTLSRQFVMFFEKMIIYYPNFEFDHKEKLCNLILSVLSSYSNPYQEALDLISLMHIDFDFALKLMPLMKSAFFSRNKAHRLSAPRALIHIVETNPQVLLKESVEIFQLGICDFSSKVKCAVIKCFDDDSRLKYLISTELGKSFMIFAEDKNADVRTAYYNLLRRYSSFSPVASYITLRKCIIKLISAIRTNSTTSECVNYVKSLPMLILASKNIIYTYEKNILEAIVQKMTISAQNERVLIELDLQLSIYLVKSLETFASLNGDSIFPYIDTIRPVLIDYIHGRNRELKECVVDLLTTLLLSSDSLTKVYSHLAPIIPTIVDAVGSSTSQVFRVKALKFIGAIGAISPNRVGLTKMSTKEDTVAFDLQKMKKNEFWMAHFGEVIFDKLLSMMEDKDYIESQQMVFHTAISVVSVMTTIPNKSLEKLIGHILSSIKNSLESQKSDAFSQLENLILIAKQRVCPFVPEIMRVIDNSWSPRYLVGSLRVIIALVIEVHTDFTDYVAPLFPRILESLSASTTGHPDVAKVCLPLLAFLGPSYSNAVSLIFPQICHVIELDTTPKDVLIAALTSMRYLVQNGDPTFHATSIFSAAVEFMGQNVEEDVRKIAIDIVFSLMVRIGESVVIYAHRIIDVLGFDQENVEKFKQILDEILNFPFTNIYKFHFISKDPPISLQPSPTKQRRFKVESFYKTFMAGALETPKQWKTWLNNAILKWVRNSPCPSISLLHDLASNIPELLDFLTFPSFFSIWDNIGQRERQKVSENLMNIMNNSLIPNDCILHLLKLAEGLDRVEQPLVVSPISLRNLCQRVKYYSYAVHIDIVEFFKHNNTQFAHSAAKLYIELDHQTESESILQKYPIENDSSILFQLGHWNEALTMYEKQYKDNNRNLLALTGMINSANKMKKYNKILEFEDELTKSDKNTIRLNSLNFARAYFTSKKYDKMYEYASLADPEILETHVLTAVSLCLLGNFKQAEKSVETGFHLISQQFNNKGYSEAYNSMIYCQVLWELHEIIKTKGKPNSNIWRERISSTKLTTESWTPLIMLRLAFTPQENQAFLQYLNISLQDHRLDNFIWLFNMIPNQNLIPFLHAKMKYLWAMGRREEALEGIDKMIQDKKTNVNVILSYIDWTIAMKHDEKTLINLGERLKRTVSQDSSNYGLTQRWASVNFHLFQLHPENLNYAVEAVRGFVPAIKNSASAHFSDVLQLLWIFFSTANDDETFKLTEPLFSSIHSSKFVEVVPQLVGLLDHKNELASFSARNIILELAKTSKQRIFFPLICAGQSLNSNMRDKAQLVLQSVALAHPSEIAQCMRLSTVLISASVTLFDCWICCEGEKSTYLLDRAHNPKCPMDRLFGRLLGPLISDLDSCLLNGSDPKQILNEISRECEKRISEFDRIRIVDVTTERDLNLSEVEMPGAPGVYISSILPEIDILSSKQHPRRVRFQGNDGIIRPFLLKSNEDLALDQRFMQYMRLVNIFIQQESCLYNKNVCLREYEIVPLSPQVGLIQWVEGSDTISRLIEEYRKVHSIDPLLEKHLMECISTNDVDKLTPIQRYECLCVVGQITSDADLRTIIWLRSPSSQDWLSRHIHLQRSAAVNSVVGYTIGLGDRHASNIMIDRMTGDMIHIDFGDCFEVNKDRILFPEKIPFRLSRMLVSAFGLAGIDGEFRKTAEKVMSLVRDNANSLASVLELFLLESYASMLEKRMIKRTWDKMSGDDFDDKKSLTPEEQVARLINDAVDKYNISHLYTGWAPLW